MRKRNKARILSRTRNKRKALLKSLADNFFIYEKIETTEAKAKELRIIAENFITRAKDGKIFDRRVLSRVLAPKVVKKIIEEIAPKYKERNGGYTRIIRMGPRQSDGAKMAIIELVK